MMSAGSFITVLLLVSVFVLTFLFGSLLYFVSNFLKAPRINYWNYILLSFIIHLVVIPLGFVGFGGLFGSSELFITSTVLLYVISILIHGLLVVFGLRLFSKTLNFNKAIFIWFLVSLLSYFIFWILFFLLLIGFDLLSGRI